MTLYLVISLLNIPYIHHTLNPANVCLFLFAYTGAVAPYLLLSACLCILIEVTTSWKGPQAHLVRSSNLASFDIDTQCWVSAYCNLCLVFCTAT